MLFWAYLRRSSRGFAAAMAVLALGSTLGVAMADDDEFAALREQRLAHHEHHIRSASYEPGYVSRRAPAGLWAAPAGSKLQSVLGDWCERQGWQLVWKSEFSYELTSGATFDGDFEDAVRALIHSMRQVRPMPSVEMFQGNKVLVVSNSAESAE